ncbi:signal recognition particle subunit FFH/SRP54 (srp54) [Methanospirillum hungatei JF-1]|jgi:signal recognition particle subunit SRP54|uniref:Signal recognition particle 54 kDa protein n=1 Tax=Methanospirillum hungatei JF-1 (strain ATCC 27890 / DSM 864 / NBRC 100397 / JF-1) TaxID=323259 RepID=Q2FS94_METHJ|nr:signal recognition particle protein Srp54 [Methanospirillum hungatei]MBP7034883.1 signal recognition particle protein [Methanospirillum sp.]OQA55547.1 MAG: Signal recognition particle 54 kDa protein [Euryarchaeota archaeon ADurb.Bin294]ABD42710.1 signal recognition particle subunit FFH/SRP54 (srp54) [Methanospirillum hungatei JF-1]MBP9009293.1 signal recognition particle protein [Methanospirillum sp.]HOW05500.1 signal recognition particle protein Srp54 [Methanospirillum hungatei]
MLDNLGSNLKDALRKLAGKTVIDRAAVEELVKDLQRALLQADVNVKQVMQLSQTIKKRALDEQPPKGVTAREHVLRIVYEELVALVGQKVEVTLGKQIILMAGLQGSGKTTTTAKLARFFKRKGMRVAVICADTFRPGAYTQIKTLCDKVHVPCYGDPSEHDARKIVREGLAQLKEEVIIVDTQGRHALEDDLITEIIDLNEITKATHRWLVLDAALGQQAREQARRFHEAVSIDGVIITKMDGTAKGGGAMSAVAETGSGIVFIGQGETIEDLEWFDPNSYISRLLGMGDLKALAERVQESIDEQDIDVNAMLSGKFTLRDMYRQLEAVNKMGPLKQVLSMLPLGGMDLPTEALDVTASKMGKYRVIMDSMTATELDDPTVLNGSRIQRIAQGAGAQLEEVRELIKYYKMMKRTFKGLKGGEKGMQRLMKKFGKMG